jgi:allophanate hydrolase subunit 1
MPYLIPNEMSATALLFDQLPRKSDLRIRVPEGSVAVAAGMSIIYPTAMRGGWHLIGKTQIQLFDPTCSPPSLLLPGDLVRFKESTQ